MLDVKGGASWTLLHLYNNHAFFFLFLFFFKSRKSPQAWLASVAIFLLLHIFMQTHIQYCITKSTDCILIQHEGHSYVHSWRKKKKKRTGVNFGAQVTTSVLGAHTFDTFSLPFASFVEMPTSFVRHFHVVLWSLFLHSAQFSHICQGQGTG